MNQNLPPGSQPPDPRPDLERPAPASSFGTPSGRGQSFYSPPPSTQSTNPSRPSVRSASSLISRPWLLAGLGVLLGTGIALGAWYGLGGSGAQGPALVAATGERLKTFSVAAVDADIKATEQLKALLSGGAGAADPANDLLQAVNAPALKELAKTSPDIAEDIRTGRRVLYRVYLLDFLEQDGDHAELSVDGASYGDIYLSNGGTAILIPLAPGTPAQLKLLATADGGGGVTVAFLSSLGEARTRVMQVGEFEQWQVIVQ